MLCPLGLLGPWSHLLDPLGWGNPASGHTRMAFLPPKALSPPMAFLGEALAAGFQGWAGKQVALPRLEVQGQPRPHDSAGECQTRALRDGPTLRRPSAWGELLAALQESRWRQPHPPQLFWAQHRPEQSGRGSFSLKILLPQRPFDQGGKPRGLQNAPGSFLHHLGGLFLQPSSFLPGPSPEGP